MTVAPSSRPREVVPAALLIYHQPLRTNAATIGEHAGELVRHSRFGLRAINAEFGFPSGLERYEFPLVVLHYSLFGSARYQLDQRFVGYLDSCRRSYKLTFFQDEHAWCQQRYRFVNERRLDCVYTCLEPTEFEATYRRFTRVGRIVSNLTGYVSEKLVQAGRRWAKADAERAIDVGYRARRLPFYLGRGAQEKHEIGEQFLRRAAGRGLVLDVGTDEASRLYGHRWYDFLGNCRAVLGVESGTSIFDNEDQIHPRFAAMGTEQPPGLSQMNLDLLAHWEGRIAYRSVSPRLFEAAALGACQVLFEGSYSGLVKPGVHYLSLKKDFSNLDDCLRQLNDAARRRELVERCYRDVIERPGNRYRRWVADFDAGLIAAGVKLPLEGESVALDQVEQLLRTQRTAGRLRAYARGTRRVLRRAWQAAASNRRRDAA